MENEPIGEMMPEVPRELENLSESISFLEKAVSVLSEKLGPVLSRSLPKETPSDKISSADTELGRLIAAENDRILAIHETIDNLNSRLQI
jgi:hypothetical protein